MSFVIFFGVVGCMIPNLVFSANQPVSFPKKLSQCNTFGIKLIHFLSLGKTKYIQKPRYALDVRHTYTLFGGLTDNTSTDLARCLQL